MLEALGHRSFTTDGYYARRWSRVSSDCT